MHKILGSSDLNKLLSQCHVIDIYVTFTLCLKSWAHWLNLTYSVSCLHDMTLYFIQVKITKENHTLVAGPNFQKKKKKKFYKTE